MKAARFNRVYSNRKLYHTWKPNHDGIHFSFAAGGLQHASGADDWRAVEPSHPRAPRTCSTRDGAGWAGVGRARAVGGGEEVPDGRDPEAAAEEGACV